jgi:riboflavin synthase
MFTGIIEGLGTITQIQPFGPGRRFTIDSDFVLDQTKIGDSIAVSGACLTVVAIDDGRIQVDVSPETLEKTTFGRAKPGDRVNLERALRLCDRIDGHLVSGHIDGLGIVKLKEKSGNAVIVAIEVPKPLFRYMIAKGSVAVDGISLTINRCDRNRFEVSIIPHTAKLTTINLKKTGAPVNIESDMIGKYVERFVAERQHTGSHSESGQSSIDIHFLKKTGFL